MGKHNGKSLTALKNSPSEAKENKNRTGQPEFRGNANVPIKTGANEKRVTDLLGYHAQRNTQVGKQSRALLEKMGKANNGWNVTAGVHQGGLGGDGRAADPHDHITVRAGRDQYHLRFNKKGQLTEVTGKDIPESRGRKHGTAAGR